MGKKKTAAKQAQQQAVQQQPNSQLSAMQAQQQNAPPPSKDEIERRSKLYFAKIVRPQQQISKQNIQQIKTWFNGEWFQQITKQVRELYTFNEQNEPTCKVAPIFTSEQVLKVLEIGSKLFASSLNVENLTVPAVSFQEFQQDLPKQYKEKLPKDFSVQSMNLMKPVELQYNTPQIPRHPHLIIVGDTHGTFEVIENIFAKEGLPCDDISYLFNGDYVDRGSFSVEVFITLLIFKILNNKCMYMLRGNHETASVSAMYSLKEECLRKYKEQGETIYEQFCKAFQTIPLAAQINDSYYVVHGGISGWKNFDVEMLNQLNRFRDPEQSMFSHFEAFDPLSDVLWSDPTEDVEGIQYNQTRGASVIYGKTAIKKFLKSSKLQFLIRSHTCVPNGYQLFHDAHTMTLFSVPNYNEKNLGAYAVLYGLYDQDKQPTVQQQKFMKDCSPKALYELDPSVPLCFIRQFNCSDHAIVMNQPIIRELAAKQYVQQQEMMQQYLQQYK